MSPKAAGKSGNVSQSMHNAPRLATKYIATALYMMDKIQKLGQTGKTRLLRGYGL